MRWIWYLVAAVWALDALRMRVRLRSIPALPPAGPLPAGGYGAISAGVEVDDGTRAAAAAYATRHDIGLLDLIPYDTPAALAMGVAQLVDPAAYRMNPVMKGHSTGYALLAEDELFARAGIAPDEQTDTAGLVRAAHELKTFAINRAALTITPSLRAPAANPLASWPSFSALVGRSSRFVFAIQLLTL